MLQVKQLQVPRRLRAEYAKFVEKQALVNEKLYHCQKCQEYLLEAQALCWQWELDLFKRLESDHAKQMMT